MATECVKCKYYNDNGGRGNLCLWVDDNFPPPVLRTWGFLRAVVIEIEPENCPAFKPFKTNEREIHGYQK